MTSLSLKAITLDNLSQVAVAPSDSNADRSYGRRFTVAIGNDSKEVVLKDLFKRAQKLAKKATSASELNEVITFIAKLETAETEAALIYKDRDDCVYKFRSWFHRFFGGAFLGSHLDRIEKLKNKVEGKQEKLVESFKSFFEGNQPVFQSFLDKGFEVKINDQIFDVKGEGSLSDGLTLNINNGLLVISLDPQKACTLEYEGRADGFPPEVAIILSEISKEADARVIKNQEFLQSLTHVMGVSHRLNANVTTQLNFEGKEYVISSYGWHNKLSIQETAHQGTLTGLLTINVVREAYEFEFEGNKVSSIPESVMPLFNAMVSEGYKQSSSYSQHGYIRIIREGIKHIPEWHLNQLCTCLDNDLSVHFQDERGADAGGVKRDYITTLAASLQDLKTLFAPIEGSLKLPRILRENQEPIFYCNEEEIQTYNNLGSLFSRCYSSAGSWVGFEIDLITTGCFFSDALFKAVLSLKESDFAASGHPQEEAYVKIAKALLKALDTEGTPAIKDVIKCLEVTQASLESILEANDMALYQAVLLAGEAIYTDDNGDPDIEKIKSDPKKFIGDIRAAIFSDTSLSKNLKGVSLGAILDPVYQVSCGLRKAVPNSWNDFRRNDPVKVSEKIQGSVDRRNIVANITCFSFSSNVRKKAGWLKEWIGEEATEAELKTFLRFVTGGASLPAGKQIKIEAQAEGQPFPTVCTCGLGISVSDEMSYRNWNQDKWDGNKADFIRNLKQAMVVEGFQVV